MNYDIISFKDGGFEFEFQCSDSLACWQSLQVKDIKNTPPINVEFNYSTLEATIIN